MSPILGSITVGADLRVEVPVDDMGNNVAVRVDYAVADTEPAEASRLWRAAGTVGSPSSVFTQAQVRGTTVWVRASGRSALGVQLSAYTDAVSVSIDDVARFTASSLSLVDRLPVVTWTPATLTAGVRLYYAIHAANADPGDLSDSVDAEAADGTITLSLPLDDGEAITIRLEAWSGWDSDYSIVAGELGESVSVTAVQAPPAVAAHAHTHHAGGTDELDLGQLVLTAPDGSRWLLTVSNSGELGTEEIS